MRSAITCVIALALLVAWAIVIPPKMLEQSLQETGPVESSQVLILFGAALLFMKRMFRWTAEGAVAAFASAVLLTLVFRELDWRESGFPDWIIWLTGDAGSTVFVGPVLLFGIVNAVVHRSTFKAAMKKIPWKAVLAALPPIAVLFFISDAFEDGRAVIPGWSLFMEEAAEFLIATILLVLAYTTACFLDVKAPSEEGISSR